MNRPVATFHGMNPQDRDSKLSVLRLDPLGPRRVIDPTAFSRPEGHAYRKEERNVRTEDTRVDIPSLNAGVRLRAEPNTRDAMNSRILEAMPYSAARNIVPSDILNATKPLVQDTNPIDTRRSVGSYKQATEFFPDREPIRTASGIMPQTAPLKRPEPFMQNPYLQRLDAANEPRQIVRELRSAVTEDNREKYLDLSQKIANRNFSHMWVPDTVQMANIQAYELLKPKLDDFSTDYRKYSSQN